MVVSHGLYAVALSVFGGMVWGAEPGNEVPHKLDSTNFEDFIKKNEFVMVKFFAPWCGHCKDMKPAYIQTAETLKKKGSSVELAEVDCSDNMNSEIAVKYEIQGYPTLKLFRNAQPVDYSGPRSENDMVSWIERMTGPAVQLVKSSAEIPEASITEPVYVGVFKDETTELFKEYNQVASKQRGIGKFVYLIDSSATNESIAIHHYEDEPYVIENPEIGNLENLLKMESVHIYTPIGFHNFKNYFERDISIAWVCGEKSDFEKSKPVIREVAREFRQSHSFVFLGIETFKGHAEMHLAVSEFPALVVFTNGKRYILRNSKTGSEKLDSELLESEKIREFLKNIQNGSIEPYLKSEEIPADSDVPIRTVVGKNFNQVVLGSKKNILLTVFAPWCGHCKNWDSVLEKYAETVKDDDSIIVAKMNGTTNEVNSDEFSWNSFPSIYFLPAGETTPRKYEGTRTLEALQSFVEKNKNALSSQGFSPDEL